MWLCGLLLIYVRNFVITNFYVATPYSIWHISPFFSSSLCLSIALYIVCSSSLTHMSPPEVSFFKSALEKCKAVHRAEQNVNLCEMICFARLYSEYLVTANNGCPFPFKAPNTWVYIYLLKIELFLNSHYHALCTVVSFIFVIFFLSNWHWLCS